MNYTSIHLKSIYIIIVTIVLQAIPNLNWKNPLIYQILQKHEFTSLIHYHLFQHPKCILP